MDEAAANALETRIAGLCGQLNVLHAQLVDAIGEALDEDLWNQWGIRSPEQWLVWQTGLSAGRARQLIATARRKPDLPVTFTAFAEGELAVDQVVTVARYTPAHNDAEACQLAKSATVTQLRSTLSRYVHIEHKPQPDELPGSRDQFTSFFDDDGRFVMKADAPADQGAIINQAIREARDALFNAGHHGVTYLDALTEVAQRSLDTITSPSRRDRWRIYVHLDTDDPNGPAHAWLNGGPQLPSSVRDLICCNSGVRPLWHTAGLPVNVGRAQYIVPEHTRRLVLDRDRHCRHPGCGVRTFLEVHHILEWLSNGRTDTGNLCALCPKHHAAYHRGDYSMTGNANLAGALRFFDARGRPIADSGTPACPTGPPPTPAKRYLHPTGERLDGRWLTFSSN